MHKIIRLHIHVNQSNNYISNKWFKIKNSHEININFQLYN
jgi:hypothetical protein